MRILQELLVPTFVVMLVSCGVSRAPLPPSLHLPQVVQDLKAVRKGHQVTLSWTVPDESTDLEPLHEHLGITRVCREVAVATIRSCSHPIGELNRRQLPQPQHAETGRELPIQATFTDRLSAELEQQNATESAFYAVETLNKNGRSAGLSNPVEVPLAPVPDPPTDVSARITPEAVVLSFFATSINDLSSRLGSGPSGARDNVSIVNYRVYRSIKGANNFTALGFPQLHNQELLFEDRSFDWETSYEYRITPIAWAAKGAEIEGEDSKLFQVFTHDVFPPATPVGLQAVSSGTSREKFIDLTWAPNTENDLAGYNLYRRLESSPMKRINLELITTPAFRDNNVRSGETYIYSVSAVDLRGNESSKSVEASEVVP
jgi:fibronectin type 3 domain-containing protein